MGVTSLHHVSIRTQDPLASRAFFERLGFSFMEIPVGRGTSIIWRGAPDEGVMQAIQVGSTFVIWSPPLEGAASADRFDEHHIGVDHLAFGVDGRDDLESLRSALHRGRGRHRGYRGGSGARQGVRVLPRPRQRAVGVLHGETGPGYSHSIVPGGLLVTS